MRVRPDSVELAVRRIDCQRGKNVAEVGEQRCVENQIRGPRKAIVGASGDYDVIKGCSLGLLYARLARSVNGVGVVREWIGDDGTLSIVKSGVASKAALADHGIPDAVPVEAVVVGALHVNQGAVSGVVIGNVHRPAVRGDPLAIRSGGINDLCDATAEIHAARRRIRTGDG